MSESFGPPPDESMQHLAAAVDAAVEPVFAEEGVRAAKAFEHISAMEAAAPGVNDAIDTAKTTGSEEDTQAARDLWLQAAYGTRPGGNADHKKNFPGLPQ